MEQTGQDVEAARRLRRLAALCALFLYASAALVVFHRALLEGEVLSASGTLLRNTGLEIEEQGATNIILGDSVHCFMPWLRYASDALREDGRLPLWKATAFCGAPLVGNGQSALFYPLNLFALALGAPPWIHGVMAAIKVVAACWFTYLLARHFGLGFGGSLLAGFVFGFGGFTTVFLLFPLTNVSVLFPLVILAADRVALNPTALRVAGLALVCAIQHLGGHPETAFHSQALAGVAGVVRVLALARCGGEGRVRDAMRRCAWLFVGFVLGALLGAIQTVPLLEYIGESGTLRQRHGGPAWRF